MKIYGFCSNAMRFFDLPQSCIFTRLGSVFNPILWDRFDVLNKEARFDFGIFGDELPKEDGSLDYKALCHARADELAIKYPDGIAIGFSGGVDSTGIVALLIQAGYPVHKIRIIGNRWSIDENPSALNWLKRNGATITIAEQGQFVSHYDGIPENVILFGGCNDQFFHIGSVYRNIDKQTLPLSEGLGWVYGQRGLSKYLERDLELIDMYSSHLGWPVRDLFDLSVVLNFGCRYRFIKSHMALTMRNKETSGKVVQFFDNQSFQNWALTNREKNKEDWRRSLSDKRFYKTELKKIIFDVFGDEEYHRTKGKEGSWRKLEDSEQGKFVPIILGVDDGKDKRVLWLNHKLREPRYGDIVRAEVNKFFSPYYK